jgi:hypothetical protein
MEIKQANLSFHFSERLKSNFFLLEGALDRLSGLKGERLKGGREVLRGSFAALRREVNFAKQYLPSAEMASVETKLTEAEGLIELHVYEEARLKLAEALSQVTTLSGRYMSQLLEQGLV